VCVLLYNGRFNCSVEQMDSLLVCLRFVIDLLVVVLFLSSDCVVHHVQKKGHICFSHIYLSIFLHEICSEMSLSK